MNILGVSLSSTAIAAITGGTIVLVTMVVILVEAYVKAKKRYGGAIDADGDEVSGWELLMIGTRILSAEDVGVAGQERDGTASDQQDASSGSNAGATWAIALILVLLIIAGVGFWLYRRRKGEEVEEVVSRVNRTTRNVIDNMKRLEPDAEAGLRKLESLSKGMATTSWFKSSGRDFAADKNRIAAEAEAERRRIEEDAKQKAGEFLNRGKELESKKDQLGSELAELRRKEQELAGQREAAAAEVEKIAGLIKKKKEEIAKQTKAWKEYDAALADFQRKQASYDQAKAEHERKENDRIAKAREHNLQRKVLNDKKLDLNNTIETKTQKRDALIKEKNKKLKEVKSELLKPDIRKLEEEYTDFIDEFVPGDAEDNDNVRDQINEKIMNAVKKVMENEKKKGKLEDFDIPDEVTIEYLVNMISRYEGGSLAVILTDMNTAFASDRIVKYKVRGVVYGSKELLVQPIFADPKFKAVLKCIKPDTTELQNQIDALAAEIKKLTAQMKAIKIPPEQSEKRKKFTGDKGIPPEEPKFPKADQGALDELDRQKRDAEKTRDAIAASSRALKNDLEKNRKEQEQLQKEQEENERMREETERETEEKLKETERKMKEAQEKLEQERKQLEAKVTHANEQEKKEKEKERVEVDVENRLGEATESNEKETSLQEGKY